MLRVITLGAAAGGGLPQWNCRCDSCTAAWDQGVAPQGQTALAVSVDGENWFLINASPDIRAQIAATPALWPAKGHLRHSPIAGVILTNGEVDAVAGLLSLREGQKFALHAHPQVLDTLAQNSIFNVLNPANVARLSMLPDQAFEPALLGGTPSGLIVTPFTLPGKPAWYLEGQQDAGEGDTLGLTLQEKGSGKVVHVILACAQITPALRDRLRGADLVFFEGTLWRDDEIILQGLGPKTGQSMGHVSMSGDDGVIAQLQDLGITRKVFVHINNSNPVWRPDTPERAKVLTAGWEIPAPAQEFSL